jgi:hypothetical protein
LKQYLLLLRNLIVFAILLASCNEPTSKLEEKVQTLDLHYIAWACACANWATSEDIEKYEKNEEALAAHSIFIEPADSSLILPDSIGTTGDIIKFTGHFYKEKGFPKDYGYEEQRPDKARVLRYTKYEIIRRDSSKYYPETDTLVINSKAAVAYTPDSLRMEERMKAVGEENFRMGMDDYLTGLHEADEYLESVKLPVLVTEEQHFLKFIHSNGTFTIIKTDTLKSLWGMYLFDPAKKPKEVDYYEIEKEYADYYKK